MRDFWKKFEREFLTRRAVAVLVFLSMLVLLAPLFWIAKYDHIAADCYWFAYLPHVAWKETHSLFSVIAAALRVSANTYQTWQGTFTSIFFFALSPGVFGEQYYFIVPFLTIGSILVTTFYLFYVLLRKGLSFDLYTWFAVSGIVSLMQIEFMDAGTSGLYWYNGAMHYVFMQGFAVMAVAFLIRYIQKPSWILIILASFCGFFASGANFTTALWNAEWMIFFVGVGIYRWKKGKLKAWWPQVLPTLVSLVGLFVNMAAPGNDIRQANFDKQTPLAAIVQSFQFSLEKMVEWADLYVLLLVLLLIPLVAKALMRSNFSFRYPLALVVFLFCIYTSMFTPACYAMGTMPIDRNLNICQNFFYLALIFSLIYVCGFLLHRLPSLRKWVPQHFKNVWGWAMLMAFCVIIGVAFFCSRPFLQKHQTSTTYIAVYNLQNGNYERMWQEYLARLQEYHNSQDSVLYVEPYHTKPALLFVNSPTECSIYADGQLEESVANWYNRQAIYEILSEE